MAKRQGNPYFGKQGLKHSLELCFRSLMYISQKAFHKQLMAGYKICTRQSEQSIRSQADLKSAVIAAHIPNCCSTFKQVNMCKLQILQTISNFISLNTF
jgi:hypothetical protein